MIDYNGKKIGIWGWGVAGKSVALFLLKQHAVLTVFDAQELTEADQDFLKQQGISYSASMLLEDFLEAQTYIFPSPGIDLRPYQNYTEKWLSELDLFAQAWHKPSIALTGTAGKTSLASLLAQALTAHGLKIALGGNIGIGLLDLLAEQENTDYAVLELSSYQLERSTRYAPDYELLTNFYANHLDRHGSIGHYFQAKLKLFAYQKSNQTTIIPLEFYKDLRKITSRPLICFALHEPSEDAVSELLPQDILYYSDEQKNSMVVTSTSRSICLHAEEIPALSYASNWMMVYAVLSALGISQQEIKKIISKTSFVLPAYRGELVAIKHGIAYYNDSKSTLFESTRTAVEKFSGKPLILMLGGLSKGVNRTPLISQLAGKVLFISCFGKESQELYQACLDAGIDAAASETLEKAVQEAQKKAPYGSSVLFSPAGSSFDLFKNYQHRGEAFNLLIDKIV